MKLAIFDVCDTIYKVNTTFEFLDYFFAKNKKYIFFRKISKLYPVQFINFLFYKFFKLDLIKIYATFFLKGKKILEIRKFSKLFVRDILVQKIKKHILKKINHYKDIGYQIVLMSGSYDFIVKQIANYIGAKHFYASKLKKVGNVYTGKYKNDILLNKYQLFKKKFKQFDKLVVTSNNTTDLKLMMLADQAFAICNNKKDLKFWKLYNNVKCIKDFK